MFRKSTFSGATACAEWLKPTFSAYSGQCAQWKRSSWSFSNGNCAEFVIITGNGTS